MTNPPNRATADFAAAAAAFQRGDLAGARRWALRAAEADPDFGQAQHLLAAVAGRSGDAAEAGARFGAAVRLLPDDPQIANNFGNWLEENGDADGAMTEYRRAVALAPDFVEALTNLGLAAGLAHYDEGLAALRHATALDPESAKAWQALGLLLREGAELGAAADALATADRLAPGDVQIIQARALVESARGGDALPLIDRAFELRPGDPELALERAAALFRSPEPAQAVDYLAMLLRGAPAWQMGHLALSNFRWQLGEGAASTRSFDEALAALPGDIELRLGYLATLTGARRYEDALTLADRDRALFAARPEVADAAGRLEAVAASESGDLARAGRLFDAMEIAGDPGFGVSQMRFLLRARRFAAAARLGEMLAARFPDRAIWTHLATAWRMTGDRRAEWLDDPRLIGVTDIAGLDLGALATRLRTLHVTTTHPFDQSLRGGTQTDGNLLLRADPELRELRDALDGAVAGYIAALPPADPGHPTLRERRDGFRIAGSWSVRLTSQGFHINHYHGEGWLSSAFYVALPPGIAEGPAGWLTLGQPSTELGLDIPPLATIEPKPGRLVLFPSTMWHGTVPFADGERLTVAFDVLPKGR